MWDHQDRPASKACNQYLPGLHKGPDRQQQCAAREGCSQSSFFFSEEEQHRTLGECILGSAERALFERHLSLITNECHTLEQNRGSRKMLRSESQTHTKNNFFYKRNQKQCLASFLRSTVSLGGSNISHHLTDSGAQSPMDLVLFSIPIVTLSDQLHNLSTRFGGSNRTISFHHT